MDLNWGQYHLIPQPQGQWQGMETFLTVTLRGRTTRTQWVESTDSGKHPTMHWTTSRNRVMGPKTSGAKVEKPWSSPWSWTGIGTCLTSCKPLCLHGQEGDKEKKPGIRLGGVLALSLHIYLWGWCYCSLFSDEETEPPTVKWPSHGLTAEMQWSGEGKLGLYGLAAPVLCHSVKSKWSTS